MKEMCGVREVNCGKRDLMEGTVGKRMCLWRKAGKAEVMKERSKVDTSDQRTCE